MPTEPIETIAPVTDTGETAVLNAPTTDELLRPEATLADEKYRVAFETIVDAESMAFLDFDYFGIRK